VAVTVDQSKGTALRALPQLRDRRHRDARGWTGIEWAAVDWTLLGACIALCGLGLVMVYSTSRRLVDDPFYYVQRQSMAMGAGLVVFLVVLRIDYRKFRDFSLFAYLAVVGVLALVVTSFGSTAKGSQAWFQLPFGFQLQPSELAKFGLIVALAGYVNAHRGNINPWRLTVIVTLALLPLGLIMLQPDLGTDMVLAFIVLGLLAVAGCKGRYMVALALLAATGIFAIVSLGLLKDYQIHRFTSLVTADKTAQDAAYNQTQSKQAIGSGGLTGQGLFQGGQTRNNFVPEQHTDFIFSAVGEELGFAGGATVLALFGIMMWRIWRIAKIARDYYGTLVCAGVLSMFGFMAFENLGMTMGIMPVTGIPLPFMSYGGSSIVACFACVALVTNVHYRRFT
jgi:rod shape determining protein RodA